MAAERPRRGATAYAQPAGADGPPTSVTAIAGADEFRYAERLKGASDMAKAMRWAGYALGAVVAIWLISTIQLTRTHPRPEHLARPTAAQLADAPRQLTVYRCIDCHFAGL